jgi:alpha-L-fucosidase 2
MEWKNGTITRLAIKSNLGGNFRIRSYSPLKVEGDAALAQANGENSNPFYQVPLIKNPVISAKAKLEMVKLKGTFLYDIETKAGKEYAFTGL